MTSTRRTVAEGLFSALTRPKGTAMSDIEAERDSVRENTAKLRAERLERDARTIAERTAKLKRRRAIKPAH